MKISKELTKELQEDMKRVGLTNITSWLKNKDIKIPSSASNLFESLSSLLDEGVLSIDQLQEAVAEIEECGDKKILLFTVDDVDALKGNKANLIKYLRLKFGFIPSKSNWVYKKPGDGPTFIYMHVDEESIKIKYGERHYNFEFDPSTEKVEKTVRYVNVIIVVSINSGLIELRLDNPGEKHSHKNGENKITAAAYEGFYVEKMRELLKDVNFVGFDLKPVAQYLAKKGKRIFLIIKDKSTVTGGAKQTYASPDTKTDVRDLVEFKGAAEKATTTWRTDDLTGYWKAEASDGILEKNLFMRISRVQAHIRVQRGCLQQELQYGINQIKQIQEKV